MKQAIFFLVLVACSATPYIGNAYFTTEQGAYRISDSVALFTIEYRFGMQKDQLRMPIFTTRNLEHNANTGALGYEILNDDGDRTEVGSSGGLVLSNASIEDGMYHVPADQAKRFTLFVFFALPEGTTEQDYSLRVTELPFYIGEDELPNKLNVSELQYYVTPEVDLGEQ